MKKNLAKAARIISSKAHGLAWRLDHPEPVRNAEIFERWFADRGDETLRVEYDIGPESVVVDAGGYKGDWSAEIAARFGCHIHIFEPFPEYATSITNRFKSNPRVHVYERGLSERTGEAEIFIAGDSTSTHRESANTQTIQLLDVAEFFDASDISLIDLFKINIEGEEYALLERMIEKNLLGQVVNIQVQFHDLFPESEARMKAIQDKLSQTHELTWQYPWVWENWRVKR